MGMDPARIRSPQLSPPRFCNYSESEGALLQAPRWPLMLVYSPTRPRPPPPPPSQVSVRRLLQLAAQLLDRPRSVQMPPPWQGPPLRSGLSYKVQSGLSYKVQWRHGPLALNAHPAHQVMPHLVSVRVSSHRRQPTSAPCPAWPPATRRTLPR